jgi:Domain of unknown function (DUF3943)
VLAFPFRLFFAAVGASLSWASTAQADPDRPSPDTFEYTTPTEKNYLRAVLELEALTTVSVVWYVIDVRHGANVDYRWPVFERKLTGQSIGHDDNGFGTNFRGHGVGGNAYYLSARGNHLGIAESFGFAVAGATLWEFFGEIGEVVSVNDLIITPFSGIGIGEPLTQLSTFFDRQSPTPLNRVLGSLFGPINSINDTLDGGTLRRTSGPDDEWHRFDFAVAPAFTRREARGAEHTVQYQTDLRVEASERLARLRNYDGAAEHSEWFDDGNVSGMSLRAAFRSQGVTDFGFETNVVPFGYFARSARLRSDGVHGSGIVLGYSMGYHYLIHDYGGALGHTLDRAAFVQPVGAMFEYRGSLGPVSVTSRVDASGIYGGVHPMATDAFGARRAALTPILQHFDYYFGAGAQLETQLTLRWAGLEADGLLLGRRFTCVDEHVTQSIHDSWQRFAFGVGFRIRPSWLLRFFSDDTLRTGTLADARGSARESAAGLEARAIF